MKSDGACEIDEELDKNSFLSVGSLNLMNTCIKLLCKDIQLDLRLPFSISESGSMERKKSSEA